MRTGDRYQHKSIGVVWEIINDYQAICVEGGFSGWSSGEILEKYERFSRREWILLSSKNSKFNNLYSKLLT